jgi:predicted transcriptional regulator
MAEARCLRLENQDRFVWRHWAGAVLDLIAERQPIGIEALENELAAATDSADDTGHRERIREAVDMLRDNGLIGYTAK